MLLFLSYLNRDCPEMVSGRAYVNANSLYLIWMKSWSTIFVERYAAVLVDMASMRTSGLRIVSGSLLITHSQTRWKLILPFFGHHIFVFRLICGIFRFSLDFFRFTRSSLNGKHKCAWAVKFLLTLLQFLKAAKREVRIQNPSTNFAIDSQKHCWTGSNIVHTLGFHLGV